MSAQIIDIELLQYRSTHIHTQTLLANCVESPYLFCCFASKLAAIYAEVDIRPLAMFWRLLATFWQSFMVSHHFCPVLVSLLSRECWFHQLPPKAVRRICVAQIQMWAVAVCKWLSENIVLIMPTTIQPVIIENDVHLSGLGISRGGYVEKYWSVTGCHFKSPTLLSWEQQSYPTWTSVEDTYI